MTGLRKKHKGTYCVFKKVVFDFTSVAAITSKSGSVYHYTTDGVYRKANHWGRVANSRWYVEGVTNYKNQDYYTGFALWEDFYDLKSEIACFKLVLSYEQDQVLLQKTSLKEECRFTINEALRRKKEVETILKFPRYLNYYDNPELAKTKIIEALLSTKVSLLKIKAVVKNSQNKI